MAVEQERILPSGRYRIEPREGAWVAKEVSARGAARIHLPPDAIVVVAELVRDEAGRAWARISSPAGWLPADALAPAAVVPSLKLDRETFYARHALAAPGDHYGLAFPFTLAALEKAGPEFLTTAFRAAGSISPDNRVTRIVELRPLGRFGASENAFLTVAYAIPEPGLHAELFVKLPHADVEHKFLQSSSSQSEVALLRRSRDGALPVPVARYYFGDYSTHTTNFLLITERIRFDTPPIEPAYTKGYDHQVPEVFDHYRVLTRALASLVAAHKVGALGHDIEEVFPFARAARNFLPIEDVEARIDRLVDFIARVAPRLFVAEARDPRFLRVWRGDLLFGLEHKDAVIDALHRDVDYTGLCHINLNVDNAWFWRDESGALQAGLLDWGGVGQLSIAQALSSMLMMPEPETYLRLEREVLDTFIDEYAKRGGPALAFDELRLQYKASVFSTGICTIVTIIVDVLAGIPDEQWSAMTDRFDSRLQASGLAGAVGWIDNMLRDWLEDPTPGEACRRLVDRSRSRAAR